jgi:hypothetical protein
MNINLSNDIYRKTKKRKPLSSKKNIIDSN